MTDDDPADVFAALSDRTRLGVLRALWAADGGRATFAELRAAVGVEDPGRLNYHLTELTGRLVRRPEEGVYEFRTAGRAAVASLFAGSFDDDPLGPVPAEEPCPACGESLTVRHDGDWLRVDCRACGDPATFVRQPAPPGLFDPYDRAAAPAVALRYTRSVVRRAAAGFCPYCEGPTTGALRTDNPPFPIDDAGERTVPHARFACRRCGASFRTDAATPVHHHPAVVAFFHDHGRDVRELSLSRLAAVDPETARVTDRDPLRATVRFAADGHDLAVTVDDGLSVVGTERR